MPRPYGWTSGEGRYKGLGQVPGFDDYMGTANYFQQNPTNSWTATGVNVVGYNNLPAAPMNQTGLADYWNAVNYFVNNPTGNPANMGAPPTIGQWLQKNMGLVLVGGIVGLLLFRR
jgi:hypothetical protein